jgi:hypothetical protein
MATKSEIHYVIRDNHPYALAYDAAGTVHEMDAEGAGFEISEPFDGEVITAMGGELVVFNRETSKYEKVDPAKAFCR